MLSKFWKKFWTPEISINQPLKFSFLCKFLFKEADPAYSTELLTHAEELFAFAETYRGKYSDSVPEVSSFYK